jgi:hypothetical protein
MLQLALLWRCSSHCCDAATRVVVALQLMLLWHYNSIVGVVFFFFFWNDSWLVQKSSTSFPIRAKKRKTKSKKEQERALKHVLVALPSFSTFVIVGWQRCNNTSSLQQAPSNKLPLVASTTTTLVTKRNSRIQHQKKFVPFNIKQQE